MFHRTVNCLAINECCRSNGLNRRARKYKHTNRQRNGCYQTIISPASWSIKTSHIPHFHLWPAPPPGLDYLSKSSGALESGEDWISIWSHMDSMIWFCNVESKFKVQSWSLWPKFGFVVFLSPILPRCLCKYSVTVCLIRKGWKVQQQYFTI